MGERTLAELARRIALAFKSFHGFIYQHGLDDPKDILTVVRSSGICMLLNNVALSQQHGLYALLLNDKACRTECIYEKGCGPDDTECLSICMRECRLRIIDRIVEALNSYAERQHRAAKR